jgi:hypothetical protein
MADNNYPLPVLDAATGELRCPPGFVVTQPCGQGIARSPAHDMLVRSAPARPRRVLLRQLGARAPPGSTS